MKLFSLLPIAAFGQFGDPAQMAQMVMPMIKQFYADMDHPAHMEDFKQDDNGLFKTYFNFCDTENDGVLTKADDKACKERLEGIIMDRLENEYHVNLGPDQMAQMNQMKNMMTAFGEQIFNEFIDSNNDGEATLEEIEMNGYCIFRASAKMMIQMMDRNRNGKLDKRSEASMLDLDQLMKNDEVDNVRAYVPDLDKLVKKAKRILKKADMDGDKAYDDRELAKVMLDLMNLLVKRAFN